MARDGYIQGNPVAPMPCGARTNCAGVGLGVTRPYLKPWEIAPIRAANEPAKPPLPGGDISAAIPFTAQARHEE